VTEEQELGELLASEPPAPFLRERANNAECAQPSSPSPNSRTDVDYALWQVLPNNRFRPGSRTLERLNAGAYCVGQDDNGLFLQRMVILSDEIVELPEASHLRVLAGIRKFWRAKDLYQKHGLIYKRGVLLWGPPGGGKTVTAQLLVQEIIRQYDGVVIVSSDPRMTVAALVFLRRIEPERPLIVVLEDVDETIASYGEHSILAMLDGEHQTDNVVYVATTNYPERLGARLINRPSRFDERVKIGMPSAAARMVYLRKACAGAKVPLERWCDETEGLSIAHLRELVVAVVCLEQDYEQVLQRLRGMEMQPKPVEGFRRREVGLLHA